MLRRCVSARWWIEAASCVTLVLGGALAARGQSPAQASPASPAAREPSADEDSDARALERRPRSAPAVAPGRPAIGSGTSELRPSPPTLVREGAFLRERRGRLVQGPEQQWVYVFDADAQGRAEPTMVMQPCRRLEEMRHVVGARDTTVTFRTSGMVFVQRGQNYFLPTYFSVLADDVLGGTEMVAAEGSEAPSPAGAGAGAGAATTSADELLSKMGAGQGRQRTPTSAPKGQRRAPRESAADRGNSDAAAKLLREGMMLTSRRGRVTRGGEGELVFVNDNSPGSRGGEPPLTLMPCLNIEAIGGLIKSGGDSVSLTLSGVVYVYEERNYLMPTLYLISPDVDGNVVSGP